jgi:hypothetical protein
MVDLSNIFLQLNLELRDDSKTDGKVKDGRKIGPINNLSFEILLHCSLVILISNILCL